MWHCTLLRRDTAQQEAVLAQGSTCLLYSCTALPSMQGAWGAGLLRTLAVILATRAYQICELR